VIAIDRLEQLLTDDAVNEKSSHDFGKKTSFLPPSTGLRVFAYPSGTSKTRAQNYWRDVGRGCGLYEPNNGGWWSLNPELKHLTDHQWPIWTYSGASNPRPSSCSMAKAGRRAPPSIDGGRRLHHSGAYVSQSLLSSECTHRGRQQGGDSVGAATRCEPSASA